MLAHVHHAKLPRTRHAVPAHGKRTLGAHRAGPQAADDGEEHGRPARPPALVTLPQVLAPVKGKAHELRAERIDARDKGSSRLVGGSANRSELGFVGHIARSASVENRDLTYSARFYTVCAGYPEPIPQPRSPYTAVQSGHKTRPRNTASLLSSSMPLITLPPLLAGRRISGNSNSQLPTSRAGLLGSQTRFRTVLTLSLWQPDEFRSSPDPPAGSQMSFGVIPTGKRATK